MKKPEMAWNGATKLSPLLSKAPTYPSYVQTGILLAANAAVLCCVLVISDEPVHLPP